jgi:uncharacterized iron-regulated protein
MGPLRMAAACLFCAAVVQAVAAAEIPPPWPDDWQSKLGLSHPLTGQIWSVRDQKITTPGKLSETIAEASVVLVGEVHDNVDHHRIQGWSLEVSARFNRNRKSDQAAGAAVFEQIRTDQQPALDRFAQSSAAPRRSGTADDLFGLLEWDTSGWPLAAIYKPVFEVAIRSKLAIVPGEPRREQVRAVANAGLGALSGEERSRLKLDQPLPAELQEGLLIELEASHCGLMPKSAFTKMADAQRYRDAHLATALTGAANRHGWSALIAGNGHVRKDRGVPRYLQELAPGKSVVSVMLVEVEAGNSDPAAYIEKGPDGEPVADYIVFTPRAERADPCERMREQFGKKG